MRSRIEERGRGRGPGAGWLGLLVACAVLAAQVAGLAHLILERHAVCSEHGEVVHATDPAKETQPPAGGAPRAPQGKHGHEHCAIVLLGEKRVALVEPAPAAPAPAVLDAPRPSEAPRAPFTRLALYRLAPSHSPPAAA